MSWVPTSLAPSPATTGGIRVGLPKRRSESDGTPFRIVRQSPQCAPTVPGGGHNSSSPASTPPAPLASARGYTAPLSSMDSSRRWSRMRRRKEARHHNSQSAPGLGFKRAVLRTAEAPWALLFGLLHLGCGLGHHAVTLRPTWVAGAHLFEDFVHVRSPPGTVLREARFLSLEAFGSTW